MIVSIICSLFAFFCSGRFPGFMASAWVCVFMLPGDISFFDSFSGVTTEPVDFLFGPVCFCFFEGLRAYLTTLKPHIKSLPSYIKDITDFINKIRQFSRLSKASFQATMDVSSLQ